MKKQPLQPICVGGMSESCYDIGTLQRIKQQHLGNYTVLFAGPWSNDALEKVADFCRCNGYRFVMDEVISRLDGEIRQRYRNLDLEALSELAVKYRGQFGGSLLMCEYGGLTLYWPSNTVAASPMLINRTLDMIAARTDMIAALRRVIESSQRLGIPRPYITIEASGLVADYLYQAGIDRVDYEMTYDQDNELFYSAVKGAALCYSNGHFGADMAMVWYGGNQHDRLWFRRWYISLLHAFIRGADPIYAEHGLMDYKALGKTLDTEHKFVAGFRRELKKFFRLIAEHPKKGQPEAELAVLKGNLDSFCGLGQLYRWGQRGQEIMRKGDAEYSWELFHGFYRRNNWEYRYKAGNHDYSGNPPGGQVDVISAVVGYSHFKRYRGMFFLGSHVMTDQIYDQLVKYVSNGGYLLLCAAHLNCSSRAGEFQFFRNGDVSELCGVKLSVENTLRLPFGIKFMQNCLGKRFSVPLWSADCDPKYADGSFRMAAITLISAVRLAVASESFADHQFTDGMMPVITVNNVGKGKVILVNSLDFPGHSGLRRLYQDLLRMFAGAFIVRPEIECSDRVRYAIYREKKLRCVYLLNTEESLCSEVILRKKIRLVIPPAGLRILYVLGKVTVVTENPVDRITAINIDPDGKIICYFIKPPCGTIRVFRDAKETGYEAVVNG